MRIIILIFLSFVFNSCSYFSSQKKESKIQMDTIVDFTSIDAYPILPECDEIASKELQKACFYKLLTKRIQKKLIVFKMESDIEINDTILIHFMVDSKGLASVESIQNSKKIKTEFKKLDSIIKESFSDLPQMKPALKRGIPIKTVYTLPIVIKTE